MVEHETLLGKFLRVARRRAYAAEDQQVIGEAKRPKGGDAPLEIVAQQNPSSGSSMTTWRKPDLRMDRKSLQPGLMSGAVRSTQPTTP
jgi:hypothetical protein